MLFLILILLISQTMSSFNEFCESNHLKSVFSIDRDLYFVSFKNNQNMIWKFDFKSNSVFIDNKMQSFVEKLGFNVSSPILGFKFTEVYECSKDKNRCKDKDYKFEDFDHCIKNEKTLDYCRSMSQLQDMTFLIGFDNQSKQSYRAIKQNNLDFEVISDNDMPFKWRSSAILNDKTFLRLDPNKDVLVAIAYNKRRFELAMVLRSRDIPLLKVALLDTHWWFDYWKSYPNIAYPERQSVGFIERDSQIFAITTIDGFIYSYKAYGPQNTLRKFEKQNLRFYESLNCSSDQILVNTDIVSVSTSSAPDIPSSTTIFTSLLLIVIAIIIILVLSIALIAYFYRRKTKFTDQSPKTKVTDQSAKTKVVGQSRKKVSVKEKK